MAASETSKYKFTYFNLPGRGEAIRATLAIGQEEFDDVRIAFAEWGELKPTTRWGSLPMLELEDGTVICQTRNILRYIGRMTGYYPFHDPKRACKVDEILDVWEDIISNAVGCGSHLEDKEEKNAASVAYLTTGAGATLLAKLDKFIGENSGGKYAVGKQLSVADMMTWSFASWLVSGWPFQLPAGSMDNYENINKIRYNFAKRADMAKYLNKHFVGANSHFGNICVYAAIDAEGTFAPPPVTEQTPATEDHKAGDVAEEEPIAEEEPQNSTEENIAGEEKRNPSTQSEDVETN